VQKLLRFKLPAIEKQLDEKNNNELPWPKQIQQSYVISIRKHRLNAFNQRMGPWSKHVTHLPGTVGANLNARNKAKIRGHQKRFSNGQMGCYDSHVRVWKKVVENNCTTLVMEDDASMFYNEEIAQRFAHLFQQLESNKIAWDFIYLGTYETAVVNNPVAQGIYPCTEWHGLFCYLIKPSAAKLFLNNAFPMTRAVDVSLQKFMGSQSKLKFYKAVPRFGFVVSLNSDTRR
jgi:GR25 family glycosyltransferase involved in LPS biosynthesis